MTERRWRDHQNRLRIGAKSLADGSFQITDASADKVIYDFEKMVTSVFQTLR